MVGNSELIIDFTKASVDASLVARVKGHLDGGGLLVHPTETVYGIGSAIDVRGLDALARLKHRDTNKPFLMLVADEEMLADLGFVVTAPARNLITKCWPGAVTLVLPVAGNRLPDQMRGPGGGVAVRQPAHPAMLALIKALGMPISSTSANLVGALPAASVEAVPGYFPAAVAAGQLLLLDGGTLPSVQPSSIVDCLGESPRLIREGAVARAKLESLVGRLL